MYAYIAVSVQQVPAGKVGEPGGLPNFLKEEKRRSLMIKRRRMRSKRSRIIRIRRRMRWRGSEGMRRTCMTAWWSGWSKSIW